VAGIDELVEKGKHFLNQGDFEKALSFFEQALLSDQQNPDLWNFKGVALRSLGRYDEALECFNRSLEIEPRDNKAS
jgi:Flp pilus assembly protein TadD